MIISIGLSRLIGSRPLTFSISSYPASYPLALSFVLLVSVQGKWLAQGMVCRKESEGAACMHMRTLISTMYWLWNTEFVSA